MKEIALVRESDPGFRMKSMKLILRFPTLLSRVDRALHQLSYLTQFHHFYESPLRSAGTTISSLLYTVSSGLALQLLHSQRSKKTLICFSSTAAICTMGRVYQMGSHPVGWMRMT